MKYDKRFLYRISKKLFSEYGNDLSNITVVFPSRRAHIFFTEELSSLINNPIWLPKFYSIEDLLFNIANYNPVHKLELFFIFYNLYSKNITNPQTIDQCYKWASILLEDFNELDKSYVNQIQLFEYLSDVKRLESWDLELNKATEFTNNYLAFFDKLNPGIMYGTIPNLLPKTFLHICLSFG